MSLKRTSVIATLLCVLGVLGGCGHSKQSCYDTDSVDTAVAAEDTIVPETQLPDTVYASAGKLTVEVETLLADVDGEISDFTDLYADAPGILTFRGSPRRDAPFAAKVSKAPTEIEVAWRFTTGLDKIWGGGSGWTGQPVYIEWPAEMVTRFKDEGKVTPDFGSKEVVVGSLDGKVYFINPESGKASRPAIDTHNPIKGSVSLDPTLNGLLYVGQGIHNTDPYGQLTIDLFSHRVIQSYGKDRKAGRGWTAYDSSAVRVGDFVFRPGENGALYKWYAPAGSGEPRLHSVLRYRCRGAAPGMESSMAVYRNYGYIGDNHGNLLCINLNTLRPVWMYFNHDDTDASPVVAVEDGRPYVYTACEVDRQGEGYGYFVKLDALTGESIWEYKAAARLARVNDKHFDGGFYATPLLGRGDASGLVFANIVYNDNNRQNGSLIALDRASGALRWNTPLKRYAWSSPVAVMGPQDKMYIFNADTYGNVYVIDAADGKILATKSVGSNFESSPVAVGNAIIVGSRGDTIFEIRIK